jgi:hypothetical protein
MQNLRDVVSRLADRGGNRSEATIQADVRTLLLTAPFALAEDDLREVVLESPVGDRRRIDVETGTTVIEVKRDLRRRGVLDAALDQLTDYVRAREASLERRYVGVLTDGAEWRCYHLTEGGLREASRLVCRKDKPDVESLVLWLEGVLATVQSIPPNPEQIAIRLGASSSAHALDRGTLSDLFACSKHLPELQIKRQLWAKLLTTAFGSQFQDDDSLFVEHTLLVNTAEILAHAVLGLDVVQLSAQTLLSGVKLTEHGIHGVVEPDFFDWVLGTPGGEAFVRTLARRLARFDWQAVKHDVLKVLYESIISPETRKKLGEYYTPDWLAEGMIEESVRDPLSQRVLDPACGSGTFLFHAVRRYLDAADAAGQASRSVLEGLSSHVLGMDVHPVAVTLARVTYVLAIGTERLRNTERGPIQVPVYLGDSMQWQRKGTTLLTAGYLAIQVEQRESLWSVDLRFPEALLADARTFDALVDALANKASDRERGSPVPSLVTLLDRLGIAKADRGPVETTFATLCRLHDEGRDHIWGYFVRNLARPFWLAQPECRVDVLVGNPPWLAYRHMTPEMQLRFRDLSLMRGLWHGAKVATHQDLSGLFLATTVQLYLRRGGRFAYVMPNATLDRAQFEGLRSAEYPDPVDPVGVAFEIPWDLRRLRPHFFPRGSAVVFGVRVSVGVRKMPKQAEFFTGRLDVGITSWAQVCARLERRREDLAPVDPARQSPYTRRFRQGASVVPRVLFLVKTKPPSPLGLQQGTIEVESVRSANEKNPWKQLESLEAVLESEYVYPVYLGEQVLPYRLLPAGRAVLPVGLKGLLDLKRIEMTPRLARWWRCAEDLWLKHRSSDRFSLIEQLNYHDKLSNQLPLQPIRVVYTKSGMHLAAARVESLRHIIDHTLYWGTTWTREEARFLCAILNSAEVTRRVRPLMSYGKDERHIDKHVWNLPIPAFLASNEVHAQIVELSTEVEAAVAALPLEESSSFVTLRRAVRGFLEDLPAAVQLETLVVRLLNG